MEEINKIISLIGLFFICIRTVYNLMCLIINTINGNVKKSDKRYKLVLNRVLLGYVLFFIVCYYIVVKLTYPQMAIVVTIILSIIDLLTHYYLFAKDNMYLTGCTFKSDKIKKKKKYLIIEEFIIKYYYQDKETSS